MKCLLIILFLLNNNSFAEQRLKVGTLLPLTGFVSQMGKAFQNGVDLYKERNPNNKVDLIYGDHKYDGKATLSEYHKMTKLKKVDLTLVWGNTPAEVLAPVAEKEDNIVFAISMVELALRNKNVVTYGARTKKFVDQLATFVKDEKSKHPTAVYLNIGSVLETIKGVKEKLDIDLIEETVEFNANNFSTLITRLKKKKSDSIILFLLPEQALIFAKQAKIQKFDVPVIGGDIFADDTFIKEFKSYMSDFYCSYSEVNPDFIQEYYNKYKTTSYIVEAATGYSVMELLNQKEDWNKANFKENFNSLNYDKLPLTNSTYSIDNEYGSHIDMNVKLYQPEDFLIN